MSIRVSCGECSKPLKVADKYAGKRVRCPGCQAIVSIPEGADSIEIPASGESVSSTTTIADPAGDVPDDWLFGDERRAAGARPVAEPAPGDDALPGEKLPPKLKRKSKGTFVAARGELPPGGEQPLAWVSSEMIGTRARTATKSDWRDHLFWVLLLAIAPLAVSTLWHGRPVIERLHETIQPADEQAGQKQPGNSAPSGEISVDDFFSTLPDHKISGAHLARDSWAHWGYAALSALLFLSLLTQTFANDVVGPGRLLRAGIITGTIGIVLLLAFQWLAAWTLGFNLRGRGIVVVLFYLVKFIAFSYRMALDPEYGFPLSFLGFTCGVGLCEELCKALPIVLFLRAQPHAGWRSACVVGLASGVGFGVSEGIMYSGDMYNGIAEGMTYLVRFASCVALHSTWAGTVALLMNRNQDYLGGDGFDWEEAGNFILRYLLIAMVLHGLYDTLLKKDYAVWALAIAIISFGWLAWLVHQQRAQE